MVLESLLCVASISAGAWKVSLDEQDGKMVFRNAEAGVEIAGKVSFTSGQNPWKVMAPRDAVDARFALVDPKDNVQGYVSFQSGGDRLEMLVYHRTAQAYEGTLRFDGSVQFREDAFACRTRASVDERVLQLGSGDPDSALNDSLFSPKEDLALRFRAANLSLKSAGAGSYQVTLSGRIQESAESTFVIDLAKKYYQSRYIPYYKAIDRKRCPRPPTGWMSWNLYFDKATAEDNLAEARIGQKYLQPFGMEFWSIESWQGNSDQLPVSKFYNMNLERNEKQFPLGMKKLADDIRALGFRPGLWTAPFGTGNDAFYAQHKGWFLHDKAGKPIRCWNGKYTLDPTVPEALEHLKKIHRIASQEWGYEYFKIDGMSGRSHGYCAHLYERPDIRALFHDPSVKDPFERCVRAFREGIGPDRVFLACQGHFTGAETAYADASRTGADIVHPNQPVKWANIMLQARCTVNQIFAHNIVFYADPDTLLVGDALETEQARVTTTIVSLPGQMMFAGDKLAELRPERMKMLQQTLPVANVHPTSLYPYFHHLPVWNLAVARPFGSWHVVALFNWEDEAKTVGFDFREVGEPEERPFAFYEFWTQSWQGVSKGSFSMRVPARSVRLVAMHPAADRPQYLSSDRHITQGAVELRDLSWKEGTLSSTLQVIGGFPLTARYRVPVGYQLKACDVPAGVAVSHRMEPGQILAVTLATPETRDVPVKLSFLKK